MIPGAAITPRVLLEKMLERIGEIEHLVILEHDKEGFINIYTSRMTAGDAAWIQREFNKRF